MKKTIPLLITLLALTLSGCNTTSPKSGGMSYHEKPKIVDRKSGAVEVERKFEFVQAQEASEPTTIQISTNGTATVSFGAQFDTQATRSKFAAFQPYHWIAIGCFLIGLSIVVVQWTRTVYGIGLIFGSVFLSAWATFAPSNGFLVTVLLIGGAVWGIGYILFKYVPKQGKER